MKISKKQYEDYSIINAKAKSIKSQANKQEEEIVKIFKTPNSGAIQGLKTDLFVGNNAIDVKTALKSNRIIIDEDMLRKLINDALESRKDPVLLLNFPKADLIYKKWVLRPIQE